MPKARNYVREKRVEDAKGGARKKARAARNRARLKMGLKVGDGKVANHKNGNTNDNGKKNLNVQSASASNRQGGLKGRKSNGTSKKAKRKTRRT